MDENIKNSIETALQPLIGLPLSIAHDIADTKGFHFGSVRPGHRGKGTVGSHVLHVQCTWRLVDTNGIITGFSDHFYGADPETEPDPQDPRAGNLQKVRMAQFMGDFDDVTPSHLDLSGRRIVASVEADQYGSVDIGFNDNTRLQLFPDGSSTEDWRFFSTEPSTSRHFVIVGGKIK